MALLAAALTSLPAWPVLIVSTVLGMPAFGIFLVSTMFVPALLGIVLLQMPLKTLLLWHDVRDAQAFLWITCANLMFVFGLALAFQISFGLIGAALLALYTLTATAVWTTLDDRALYGRSRYSQGRYHG